MKDLIFYLPSNLSLELFEEMKLPLREKHFYIINLVCCKTYFQKFTVSERGFVNISFKEIEAVLSRKEIRPTKNKLIDLGILVEDPSFSDGNYAKSYKLSATYCQSGLVTYYPKSFSVVNNFAAISRSKINYPRNVRELNYQYQNLKKLEIDEKAAINYLIDSNKASYYNHHTTTNSIHDNINYSINNNIDILHVYPFLEKPNEIKRVMSPNKETPSGLEPLDFKLLVNIENTKRFSNKDIYFSCNSASGRLYNNFTGIKRDLREYIYVQNTTAKLHHLDLSNSQPFLLNYYLMKYFGVNPPQDVLDYINLTSTGQLYEYIQVEVNPSNLSRDDLKKSIMKDLFFKATHYTTELEKAFQMHFPNVYNLIQAMKQKDYRLFSIELQRLESTLFVHLIGDKLRKDTIYFLTVHDSVYFLPQNQSDVRNAVLSECKRLKLTPHLKYGEYYP